LKNPRTAGQAPLHAARTQSAGVFARREHAHVLAVDGFPVREVAAFGEGGQRTQVARVVRRGVRRQPPFLGQVREVAVDELVIDHDRIATRSRATSENGAEAAPSINGSLRP
jgi:hypothetical protein